MTRYETIQMIMDRVKDEIVVGNIGHPSQEIFQIRDRPRNFYMLGSMGLASSIGLGLALSREETVIVIEGEGSVLMNLGSLATIGVTRPRNLCLFIIDNESYGSTGFQPSFTADGLDLAAIARSCGIENTRLCRTPEEFENLLPAVLGEEKGPYCTVIKTSRSVPDNLEIIPYRAEFIKERFKNGINAKKQ